MGWDGTGAMGSAALETGVRGGKEFAVTTFSLRLPQAWGRSDAKEDMKMHLAGREGEGEKQLQHSSRALF